MYVGQWRGWEAGQWRDRWRGVSQWRGLGSPACRSVAWPGGVMSVGQWHDRGEGEAPGQLCEGGWGRGIGGFLHVRGGGGKLVSRSVALPSAGPGWGRSVGELSYNPAPATTPPETG